MMTMTLGMVTRILDNSACDNVNFSMIGTSFLPVMRTNGTDTSNGGGGGDDDGGDHRAHHNNNKCKHSGSMQTLTKGKLRTKPS